MEAEVLRRRNEERLEQVTGGQCVEVGGDVEETADDRGRPAETQQPVQVEGGDLGVVTLVVGEVEVIG